MEDNANYKLFLKAMSGVDPVQASDLQQLKLLRSVGMESQTGDPQPAGVTSKPSLLRITIFDKIA